MVKNVTATQCGDCLICRLRCGNAHVGYRNEKALPVPYSGTGSAGVFPHQLAGATWGGALASSRRMRAINGIRTTAITGVKIASSISRVDVTPNLSNA